LRPREEIPIGINVRNLLDLDVPFHFAKDSVSQLRDQCPILEELLITVKRNKSSESEAEMYRCFGEMANLRDLSLQLECSNWRVTRDPTYAPDFDEGDQEPVETGRYPWLKRGELKETLINCAVDEALACSIWKTISQNKTGRPLEHLRLQPTGAGEYGTSTRLPPAFTMMVKEMARLWRFERVLRDDTEDFTVMELRRVKSVCDPQDPEFWEVFRSVWPSKDGSKTFRDDWASFPL
jgi:hypothetical protein